MGVPALHGRFLTTADMRADAPPAGVLGFKFWQRRFGGDMSVIGRQMTLNGRVYTVVGIMPKRFMWRGADVYLPIEYRRGEITEGVRIVHVLGRLKPGVTEAQAEADLRPIVDDLRRLQPDAFPENWRVGLLSFEETFPSGLREELWILFGAVGLLLLIACANVSNLLLSKASAREREMAVRAAMGAGRLRLVRQLLTESLLLSTVGAVLGILFAYLCLGAVLRLVPPFTIPDESEITINGPVLLFTLGITIATAIVFGLAPAWQGSSQHLANPLKESARTTGSRSRAWFRAGLVVTEVALSLVLLVGSGLSLRTLLNRQSMNAGPDPDRC
jgi:predicted permease